MSYVYQPTVKIYCTYKNTYVDRYFYLGRLRKRILISYEREAYDGYSV